MNLVTETSLVAVYEMLVELPPFKRWNLPPSHEVRFRARGMTDCMGQYEPEPHTITISTAKNGHLDTVIKTMAHEVIHLYLFCKESPSWDKHDKTFTRLSSRVAASLGFDPKEL